jgi:putative PIN family toxin of toxin-antitoxin system
MSAAPPVVTVIDTNVLLDFWVFDDPRVHPLRQAVEAGHLDCVRSMATDDELADVLQRPAFADRLAARAIDPASLLARWQVSARLAPRTFAAPWACTDPLDQKFLDLASTAHAVLLVTKDKALLRVDRRAQRLGLSIVTAAGAVERLARSDSRSHVVASVFGRVGR